MEEEDYREFNNALSDSVLVGVIGMHNEENRIDDKPVLLELSRAVSFSIMDRMLGGDGSGYELDRDYTEIELSLLEYLFRQMLPLLKNAWSNYMEIVHTFDGIETNSRMMQTIPPDEAVAIVVIEVTMDNLKGNMNVCLPATSLEEIFRVFNSKYIKIPKRDDPKIEAKRKAGIMNGLKHSSLTVSAELGKTEISLRDLLQLQVGDIIPLDATVEQNTVTLNVQGTPWFTGIMGAKKKKYAVKVKDRLQ